MYVYIYIHIHVRIYNNPRKRMVQMMLSTYFPGSNFPLFCEGCYIYQTAVSPPCHVPRCSPAVPWHPAPLVPRHWPCLRPPRVRRPRRPRPWRRRLHPCRGAYAPSPEVKLEIWRVKLWKLMNTENSCDTIINWVSSGFQGWNASKVGIGTQLCLGPHGPISATPSAQSPLRPASTHGPPGSMTGPNSRPCRVQKVTTSKR